MIERNELKKILYNYIGKKAIIPLFGILLLSLWIWSMFLDANRIDSANAIRQRITIIIGFPAVLIFWAERFKNIFNILFDILTNCKIEKMYVTVIKDSTLWDDMDHFKGEKERYHMYTVCQENGKRFRLIKDEKLCNTRLIKGNMHTIYVLKHSKYLLEAQVGKK